MSCVGGQEFARICLNRGTKPPLNCSAQKHTSFAPSTGGGLFSLRWGGTKFSTESELILAKRKKNTSFF